MSDDSARLWLLFDPARSPAPRARPSSVARPSRSAPRPGPEPWSRWTAGPAGVRAGDQAIESKVTKAAAERWNAGTGVHLNVTSYDGKVLLTGEVPTPAIRDEIGKIATSQEYVRSVTNELLVGPETLIAARTQDTYITSKVKARLIEAKKFDANNVKVVTERRVVYLMGLVSPTEGDAAAEVAAKTSDVARVVKLFEYKS